MNRIVLIGNGFDLAHGLNTRYEDFINWYFPRPFACDTYLVPVTSGQHKSG
ncbi:AbiH family protein [Prevotella sp. tf2-5]|uniref:AbiH family protein n=1 Tax=Prevotella sp. tf2-5 TaxID=1761889 RepID=UPI0008EFD6AD|nr:Bacteriophage abortive infection AbiH [Prevotella sp. tf2-5]